MIPDPNLQDPQAPPRPLPDPPPVYNGPPPRISGNRSHSPVTSKGHLEAFAIQECQQHDTSKFTGNIASGPKTPPPGHIPNPFRKITVRRTCVSFLERRPFQKSVFWSDLAMTRQIIKDSWLMTDGAQKSSNLEQLLLNQTTSNSDLGPVLAIQVKWFRVKVVSEKGPSIILWMAITLQDHKDHWKIYCNLRC